MIAYFIRRVIGGAIQLALSVLLLYSFLIYAPGGIRDIYRYVTTDTERGLYSHDFEDWPSSWGFEKPWPLSYLAWLFDPSETTAFDYDAIAYTIKGIDLAVGDIHIQGSGTLTGDFDSSMSFDHGTPVPDFFGPGPGLLFAFLTCLTLTLMLLAVAQRWRRPQPYRVSTLPTSSSLVTWWYLHSKRPIDAAVFRGQLA